MEGVEGLVTPESRTVILVGAATSPLAVKLTSSIRVDVLNRQEWEETVPGLIVTVHVGEAGTVISLAMLLILREGVLPSPWAVRMERVYWTLVLVI